MLTCDECGAHAVMMAGPLRDGSDVCCSECGFFLGTYPTFFARFAGTRVLPKVVDGALRKTLDEIALAPTAPSQ